MSIKTDFTSKEREFWLNKLSGNLEMTTIAYDLLGNTSNKPEEKYTIELSEDCNATLLKICDGSSQRLHIFFTTVLTLLLNKYSGNEDIVIGTPVFSKEKDAVLMNEILPLRNSIGQGVTFKDFLLSVRETVMLAGENQNYPFYNLLEDLSEISGVKKNYLFDVGIACSDLQNIEFIKDAHAKLILDFNIENGKIKTQFVYNKDFYLTATIERLAHHFTVLLSKVIKNVNTKLSTLDILDDEERRKLLVEFNGKKIESYYKQNFLELFRNSIETYADHIALSDGSVNLTYREVDDFSNQVFAALRKKGVSRGSTIGVLMDRTVLLVQTIIGVWKADSAYLPIDLKYPELKIKAILDDAQIEYLISDSKTCPADINERFGNKLLLVDLLEREEVKEPLFKPEAIDSSSKAFVMYTSGSTGTPKGAMVNHAGMLNHILSKIDDLNLDSSSVIAASSSHCFVSSVWQFFAALLVGGKTVVYTNDAAILPDLFIKTTNSNQVTVLETTPSYSVVVLEYMAQNKTAHFDKLKILLLTGETIKNSLLQQWFEKNKSIMIINTYGATEVSDVLTHHKMTAVPTHNVVPIGKPIPNITIYILDKDMNLCPIGIKGEIYASGIGVGMGYINNPALTNQAFMEDPFSEGMRMYKMGDHGRWLSDGTIEFLGRNDKQVKKNGIRIELGEIEKNLSTHDRIQEVVVIAKQRNDSDVMLCCYYTCKKDMPEVSMQELRNYATQLLSDYMIPSHFIKLDYFKKNSNEKIDYSSLRDPLSEVEEKEFHEASNSIEEKLVEIWKDVLNLERVSVRDDFFDLGGDSIKAIRVISKYGQGFLMIDLFNSRTIENLAKIIIDNTNRKDDRIVRLIGGSPAGKITIVTVPNAGGDPIMFKALSDSLIANDSSLSIYSVNSPRLPFNKDYTPLQRLEDVVEKCVNEIKTIANGPIVLYGQCVGGALTSAIAAKIEKEGLNLIGVFMVSSIPNTGQIQNYRTRSDVEIFELLKNMGANLDGGIDEYAMMMRDFRHDGMCAHEYYHDQIKKNFSNKIQAKIYSIVGTDDVAIPHYKETYKSWKQFSSSVELFELQGIGHYPFRDAPDELAKVIINLSHQNIA